METSKPLNGSPPPIEMWRRTEHEDVPEIEKILEFPQVNQLFGDFDLHKMIEQTYLSLCQFNTNGEIVAFIALSDCPNIPSISPCSWLSWLNTSYKLSHITTRNALFIHLLLWDKRYLYEFLEPLLQSVFLNDPYVHNIILVVPPGVVPSNVFENVFLRFVPDPESSVPDLFNVQRLLLCMRQQIVPYLKIRQAVVEDHNYLAPILNKGTDCLRSHYGEFYLAELIEYQAEERQVIVAEELSVVVGMACINTDINLDLLNKQFELGPFYGLRHKDAHDRFYQFELSKMYMHSLDSFSVPLVTSSSEIPDTDPLTEESEVGTTREQSLDSNEKLLKDNIKTPIQITPYDNYIPALRVISSEDFIILYQEGSSEEDQSGINLEEKLSDNTVYSQRRVVHQNKEHVTIIPTYHGKQNAYSLELIALDESCDERRSFDVLGTVFECYPNMDYCIITLPPALPMFPLLQHFVRVTPRPNNSCEHELYVTHRSAILSELTVRVADHIDENEVIKLVRGLKCKDNILNDFLRAIDFENSDLMAFVFLSDSTIVGLAIIGFDIEVDNLRFHYEVEDYLLWCAHGRDQHAKVVHVLMSPSFQMHARFFIRELIRLSGCTSLWYVLPKKENSTSLPNPSLPTVLGEMIPVKPRRQIQYHSSFLEKNKPEQRVLQGHSSFALFHMNKRLCSLPKTEVNERIVVVGASETALSFLEYLLYGPCCTYLTFTNITVVSPIGLPGRIQLKTAMRMLFPFRGRYNHLHLDRLALHAYVNVVSDFVTAIDKEKKLVTLKSKTVLSYDTLMLFCGQQFINPPENSVKEIQKKSCYRQSEFTIIPKALPRNIFVINNELDAFNAITELESFIRNKIKFPIIVYGYCMEAFCCVAALQKMKIPNKNIVFVVPMPQVLSSIAVFNNNEVENSVFERMKKVGITIYSPYYYLRLGRTHDNDMVTKILFQTTTKIVALPCLAMFFYDKKSVSHSLIQTLLQSSLVYVGKLIVNNQFCTTDPNIFAAGPLTKYARKYYAEHMEHRYYSSLEIGEAVAKRILEKWSLDSGISEQDPNLVPTFSKPLILACRLPCGFHYLSVKRPGPEIPKDLAVEFDDYGRGLVTGDCCSQQGYFFIHIDTKNCVENITCCSLHGIEVHNLICLYGKHELLLNNLVVRFKTGLITNFFDFFREPWVYAIFHDHFGWLQRDNRNAMINPDGPPSFKQFTDEMLYLIKDTRRSELNKKDYEKIKKYYSSSGQEEETINRLVQFVNNNDYHLPMYANYHSKNMLQSEDANSSQHYFK